MKLAFRSANSKRISSRQAMQLPVIRLVFLLQPIISCTASILANVSLPKLSGMDIMSSDKFLHIGIIERVSKTTLNLHRHRRQIIAGPQYEWRTYEIPFTIWGGDRKFYFFLNFFFKFFFKLSIISTSFQNQIFT